MPTLAELFTPLTVDDVFASTLQVATQVGLPTASWQPQSYGREILFVNSQIAANFSVGALAGSAAGGLLDFATGDWLTLLAISNFGVTRIPATFGNGPEIINNSSAVDYSFLAGEVTFVDSVTGATYTNDADFTLLAGASNVSITITAQTAGSAGSATPGQITSLQSPLLGVTCSNPETITGVDEQSDDSLRALCRLSMARASPNGPSDAYRYFAITAVRLNGSSVGVTRVTIVQSNGSVLVYVAGAGDGVAGTVSDPATDLGAVNANIQNNCVPTGITATIVSAVKKQIIVTATVYRARGSTLSDSAMSTAVLNRIASYFSTVPIGGFNIGSGGQVFNDAIIGQIFESVPGQIVQAILSAPAADTAIASNQIPTLDQTSSVTVLQAP